MRLSVYLLAAVAAVAQAETSALAGSGQALSAEFGKLSVAASFVAGLQSSVLAGGTHNSLLAEATAALASAKTHTGSAAHYTTGVRASPVSGVAKATGAAIRGTGAVYSAFSQIPVATRPVSSLKTTVALPTNAKTVNVASSSAAASAPSSVQRAGNAAVQTGVPMWAAAFVAAAVAAPIVI